jgi:hypothetical protein
MTILHPVELLPKHLTPTDDRRALGSGPVGLGVACHFCWPALITAHVYRDDRPCCLQCAYKLHSPQMPSFLWREES